MEVFRWDLQVFGDARTIKRPNGTTIDEIILAETNLTNGLRVKSMQLAMNEISGEEFSEDDFIPRVRHLYDMII